MSLWGSDCGVTGNLRLPNCWWAHRTPLQVVCKFYPVSYIITDFFFYPASVASERRGWAWQLNRKWALASRSESYGRSDGPEPQYEVDSCDLWVYGK